MVKIKFIAQGSNTMLGGFSNGDTANVGEALARHLVDEAKVAQYVQASQPKSAEEQPAVESPKRSRKAKAE